MNAPRGPGPARSFFRRRSVLIFLGLTIIVLVGVRLALPSPIKGAANARLIELDGTPSWSPMTFKMRT